MRNILRSCAVLAVASLACTAQEAYGYQARGAGRAATPSPAATATNAVNNALQGTTTPGSVDDTAAGATATAPANPTQAPGAQGIRNAGAPTATTVAPATGLQTPAVPGGATNVVPGATTGTSAAYGQTPTVPGATTNMIPGATTGTSAASGGAYAPATQPGTTTLAPGTVAPGSVYTQAVPNRAYSSYYVPGAQPAQSPVTPMAEIPYYNSFYGAGRAQPGTVTSGYSTYPTGTYGYSSMYVAPGSGYGYGTATPTNSTARRGLFGGLFGRRNRQVYSVGPSGYTYGRSPYGSSPYGSSPYGYTAGNTTYGATPYSSGYVTTPGSYTYGAAPY
jgi:hypothetical protein